MKIDVRDLPLVDNHCHPFMKEKETSSFEQHWTLSMLDMSPGHLKHTLLYKMVMQEMARVLDMKGALEGEVISRRNALYDEHPQGYVTKLFGDAGIDTVLLDIGFPAEEFSGYSVDIDKFSKFVPANSRIIVRIEPIIHRLLSKRVTFRELCDAFCTTLDEDIRRHNPVSVKTVIAYLTGIEITKVSKDEAARAYDNYLKGQNNRKTEKAVRDYLMHLTMDACLKHELPLQIHTGIGDSPIIDLRLSDPLLLYDVITNPAYQDLQIVLVHCGYPYTAEAGFLANNYPNVWIDLSEMVPFASIGVEPKLLELLEMSPTNKILYGSDGYNIPEIFWFSSVYFRKCLERVLNKLTEDGTISFSYAQQIARGILSENSKALYKL